MRGSPFANLLEHVFHNQLPHIANGSGSVDTTSSPPTPSVQYSYADGAATGSNVAKYLRLTDVIYPNTPNAESARVRHRSQTATIRGAGKKAARTLGGNSYWLT
jgi:hypothetical protein